MTETTDIDVAQEAYAAFARGDVDGALQYLSYDIEWHMGRVFSRTGRTFNGHDGVREVFALFREALDDFAVELHSLHDARPWVLARVRIGGRVHGTHEAVAHELIHAWRMRDGCAVRLDVYDDFEEACTALGITPPPASSSSIDAPGTGRDSR